ncbi:8-oxoguanine DNA glycosylase OGG fold protein [Streptomyces coelicoflavus]|uniref:8-oxoguanine DNA glycosylase OGG fold protein n=1 Tax=Streptomyces coelicoflavus TaxID=285562 RepID=UPI003639C3D7
MHHRRTPRSKGKSPGSVRPSSPSSSTSLVSPWRPPARGPRPLILDRKLSRRLRQLAAAVGRESSHDVDGSIAAWVWSDGNLSPHRYWVYLSFMQDAADQLAAGDIWPASAAPDLLECALFTTSWETSG